MTATTKKLNILNLLGTSFQSPNGYITLQDIMKNPLIGLLFSAEWCPPCQCFSPNLINFYTEVNKTTKVFEIIFCSTDLDQESFNNHYATMPWCALPFVSDVQQTLCETFGIEGIPALIIINNKGDVLDYKGRNTMQTKSNAAIKYWNELN